MQRRWLGLFTEALGRARATGELPPGADVDQLVYEITAMLVRANFTWIVTWDRAALEQARVGIRNVLERAAGKARASGRKSPTRSRPRS
jgi:hypothetical protein